MKPLVITLGDPAGIGPEIIAKAFRQAPDLLRGCFVAGDVATVRNASQRLAQPGLPVALIDAAGDAAGVPPNCIPVLQAVTPPQGVVTGQVSAAAGRAAGYC